MEDVTDVDYGHARRVYKEFNNKNIGDCHDLHVQTGTLLLADLFKSFKNKCIKIHELGHGHFLLAPGLAWQACFKKTRIELDLLTDVGMLLMVERGIRGGICYAVHCYAKANKMYMKNYGKNKDLSYIQY